MRKAFIIILVALLVLGLVVSCNDEETIDDLFGDRVTVTFDANGGTGEMAALKVKKNVETPLTANSFEKEGFAFAGWNTAADGSGTTYADKASVKLDSDTTLYAQWHEEVTKVTISFDKNGGTGEMAPLEVVKNTETPLTANSFKNEGFAFTGWNTKSDGSGTAYADKAKVKPESDVTLYAQWSTAIRYIRSTEDALTLETGYYTIEDETVTIGGRITISGTVNLLLPDGKTLNANSGITVSEGNTLVIDKYDSESTGTGILNATAETFEYGNNYAGIGGGNKDGYRTAGTITVKYGTVTATGGYAAAGIGGGNKGSGGIITISDTAYVTATGGSDGAGIGGGYHGAGGIITISGGTVIAAGGSEAAGIGGGQGYYEDYSIGAGGTISISGGVITATGGNSGAGIGGGMNGNGGTLSVSDGTVVANGGENGAGIGGGLYANGGTVTIEGGTVSANGGANGAGIGGGNNFYGAGGAGADVTISGGSVTATGGSGAVGIGAGHGNTPGDNKTLTIGSGEGLYGGADAEHSEFLSGPVGSYSGDRPAYMEAKATTFVTVTFDANGGSGTMAAQSVPSGISFSLNANAFINDPSIFVGWAESEDGEVAYADEASISVSADKTLYAQWVDPSIITSSTTALDGASVSEYKLLEDVTINSRVTVTGTVSINLAEGKTLSIPKGIRVSEGNSLTIKGKGTLEIEAPENNNAGIGGNKDENCGTVIIEGGTIVAQCGARAAGIGGGYAETAGGNGGTITINGGVVWAMGAFGSPGIGSGTNNSGASVSGGNITITGGIVHVATGSSSAAIGGGDGADSGYITISGGTVRILCDVITTTIGAGSGGYTYEGITISDDVNIISDGAGPGNDKVLVVFKANGAEAGTIVPLIMEKSTATALPSNTFIRPPYFSNGWNTKADGTGTAYADGQSVSLDSDIILYAQWVE